MNEVRNQNRKHNRGLLDRFATPFSSTRTRILLALALFLSPLVALGVSQWKASALPCPCTVFTTNPAPPVFANGTPIEVGFKFRSSMSGYISGIRFYKTGLMAGTHTASLWNNTGTTRLAQATFTSETASGWQEVNFTPVAISANTIYTASVFMADGNYSATSGYFASADVVNDPLTAPRNGQATDGNGINTQGVFNASGSSAYPTSSFGSANYWIDVSFTGAPDTDPPAVTATTPSSSATNVNLGETISATFDATMYAATLTTSTFSVKDEQNNPVTGAVSYNNATKTVSFIADNGLAPSTTYTATLEGGSGTVVKTLDNIALPSDYTWTFTTAASDPCPCSIKDKTNPAGSATFSDSAVEVGVKVVPVANGYITALRFYKPLLSPETTHTGKIWSSTGTSLATVTFSNETEYGWQEAKLSSPLRVFKDQLYILSYGTTTAVYQSTTNGLSTNLTSNAFTVYASGDSRNAATGSANQNGVFSSTVGNYPSSGSSNASYYWIDAEFSVAAAETDLQVTVTQPKNNTFGVHRDRTITAAFNRALNASTVTGSTVRLFDGSNNQVSGTPSYISNKHQISFTPSSALAYGQRYTMKLAASIEDTEANTLGSEYTWSFTVGSQLVSSPTTAPGGPVLIVTSTGNNYSQYYLEILRAEGLNHFDAKDITQVNATMLEAYDAVVLSEMALTQSQADMFSAWVNGGGNLVGMRPDKKLAALLGLTDAGTTRANQYLTVETSSAPGQGIVSSSMQFKGTADNYTTNGATAVALLYSNASTSTSNPAVTTRSVGSSGGTAMAFTYDLAKSVIALHQGNQAWAGQERDGVAGKRANDLFFGAASGDVQPDWVDLTKLHIPQADEQQRLLANMLTEATKDRKPLPRLWYLPHNEKAALVFAGDDHTLANATGTEKTLNNWLNESATDCSVIDWECVRASNYIYSDSPLSDSRAAQYEALGFEVADHPSNGKSCLDYGNLSQLTSTYTNDLNTFRAEYPSLPNQRTSRFHCYLWNDWDSMAKAAYAMNIRYSLEYVAYPASWVSNRSPMVTGSGMNMRFTDATGTLLDIRQGVTNFDNTAASSTSINAMLDNAVGSTGYHGLFGTHYDMSGDNYERTLLAAAQARGIPTITAEQALEWLDGRDSSTFSDVEGADGQFTFTLHAAEGAVGLKAMMPLQDAGGTLDDISLEGATVTYQTQTVKGIQYAMFDGVPGDYTVTYSDYDPDAGSGGNNGGGGNSGGSSGGGSGSSQTQTGSTSSSGQKSSKKTATIFNEDPEGVTAPNEQKAVDDSIAENQPSTPRREKELIQSDKADRGISWLSILAGALLIIAIGGFIWFVIAARRRKRKNQQLWQ